MPYEKPETVRRADSVIKGQGSNLIDDPAMKKPEPKPEPRPKLVEPKPKVVEPIPVKPKPKAIIPTQKTIKPRKNKKGGKRYVNKT